MITRREWLAGAGTAVGTALVLGQDTAGPRFNVLKPGEVSADSRLQAFKTLNDKFPFSVPKTLDAWKVRAAELKTQLRVALGLYPEPSKTDLNAVVHGKIERPGYTIEKVFFQSIPGHTVCGNLYRPAKAEAKNPAVLFAHGHWANGRFHEEADAKKMVERGEEADLTQARFFMQAIPITLARLGFVVFQFDMVGYADSNTIPHILKSGVPHPEGFADADGELRLQSFLGLQAWNCIRSVDFVSALPDVDPNRIGMTGASGGGTQTFLTAALDERIACAVPAVMVSTGMQGGCPCENCSLLRVETGNVEIAGLIAPRPLALTGANDWTKEIMTKGFPELQQLYDLHGQKEEVLAKCWPEHPHNFNRPAREFMYRWMLKHLMNKDMPDFTEPTFEPLPVKQLSVFNDTHPKPKTELSAAKLREALRTATPKSFPADVLRNALPAMVVSSLPKQIAVRRGPVEVKTKEVVIHKAMFGRVNGNEHVPTIGLFSKQFDGTKVCVWVHPQGKESIFENEQLIPSAKTLVDAGFAIVAMDCLGIGEAKLPKPKPINSVYAGFTYGYNRTPLAERVHDVLTILCFAKTMLKAKRLHLAGFGTESVTTILAAVLAESAVDRVAVEKDDFRFATIKDVTDPMMLPGMLKYGDLPAMLSLIPEAKRKTATGAPMANWLTGS